MQFADLSLQKLMQKHFFVTDNSKKNQFSLAFLYFK